MWRSMRWSEVMYGSRGSWEVAGVSAWNAMSSWAMSVIVTGMTPSAASMSNTSRMMVRNWTTRDLTGMWVSYTAAVLEATAMGNRARMADSSNEFNRSRVMHMSAVFMLVDHDLLATSMSMSMIMWDFVVWGTINWSCMNYFMVSFVVNWSWLSQDDLVVYSK